MDEPSPSSSCRPLLSAIALALNLMVLAMTAESATNDLMGGGR